MYCFVNLFWRKSLPLELNTKWMVLQSHDRTNVPHWHQASYLLIRRWLSNHDRINYSHRCASLCSYTFLTQRLYIYIHILRVAINGHKFNYNYHFRKIYIDDFFLQSINRIDHKTLYWSQHLHCSITLIKLILFFMYISIY